MVDPIKWTHIHNLIRRLYDHGVRYMYLETLLGFYLSTGNAVK
jgi:hypothetical protein